jgi:hypothetical protein
MLISPVSPVAVTRPTTEEIERFSVSRSQVFACPEYGPPEAERPAD